MAHLPLWPAAPTLKRLYDISEELSLAWAKIGADDDERLKDTEAVAAKAVAEAENRLAGWRAQQSELESSTDKLLVQTREVVSSISGLDFTEKFTTAEQLPLRQRSVALERLLAEAQQQGEEAQQLREERQGLLEVLGRSDGNASDVPFGLASDNVQLRELVSERRVSAAKNLEALRECWNQLRVDPLQHEHADDLAIASPKEDFGVSDDQHQLLIRRVAHWETELTQRKSCATETRGRIRALATALLDSGELANVNSFLEQPSSTTDLAACEAREKMLLDEADVRIRELEERRSAAVASLDSLPDGSVSISGDAVERLEALQTHVAKLETELKSRRSKTSEAARSARGIWEELGESPEEPRDHALTSVLATETDASFDKGVLSGATAAAVEASLDAWEARRSDATKELAQLQSDLRVAGADEDFIAQSQSLRGDTRAACKRKLEECLALNSLRSKVTDMYNLAKPGMDFKAATQDKQFQKAVVERGIGALDELAKDIERWEATTQQEFLFDGAPVRQLLEEMPREWEEADELLHAEASASVARSDAEGPARGDAAEADAEIAKQADNPAQDAQPLPAAFEEAAAKAMAALKAKFAAIPTAEAKGDGSKSHDSEKSEDDKKADEKKEEKHAKHKSKDDKGKHAKEDTSKAKGDKKGKRDKKKERSRSRKRRRKSSCSGSRESNKKKAKQKGRNKRRSRSGSASSRHSPSRARRRRKSSRSRSGRKRSGSRRRKKKQKDDANVKHQTKIKDTTQEANNETELTNSARPSKENSTAAPKQESDEDIAKENKPVTLLPDLFSGSSSSSGPAQQLAALALGSQLAAAPSSLPLNGEAHEALDESLAAVAVSGVRAGGVRFNIRAPSLKEKKAEEQQRLREMEKERERQAEADERLRAQSHQHEAAQERQKQMMERITAHALAKEKIGTRKGNDSQAALVAEQPTKRNSSGKRTVSEAEVQAAAKLLKPSQEDRDRDATDRQAIRPSDPPLPPPPVLAATGTYVPSPQLPGLPGLSGVVALPGMPTMAGAPGPMPMSALMMPGGMQSFMTPGFPAGMIGFAPALPTAMPQTPSGQAPPPPPPPSSC